MLSLKPSRLARYKDIVRLILKYGGKDFAQADFPESDDLGDEVGSGQAGELADDLEKLGPVYVKLGQLLSTRPDLIPPAYVEALTRLQDDVEPVDFDSIQETVEAELGTRIKVLFQTFEERPLASASLGQVHVATLRDGRKVAVKVQRPGIREEARENVETLMEIADLVARHTKVGRRYQVDRVVGELRDTLAEELDYRREARNLARLREDLSAFESIVVPEPLEDLCTSRVLVMEYISGTPLSKLSPLVRTDLNGSELAEEVFRAYLHQTLVQGFFHADPHPGNVLLDQERRVVLLDCGMVGRVSEELRGRLLELLLAISEGDGDRVARIALRIGRECGSDEEADAETFKREISRLVSREHDSRLSEIESGRTVLEICRAAGRNGILLPTELTMIGKTLLNLDEIGRSLDPDFDPGGAIQRNASEIMSRSMRKSATTGNAFRTLLESKELIEKAPHRLNRILELVSGNELRLRVDTVTERALLVALQKISNRIAAGIVLGSMIIGAGLLARVETEFTLFGYPGLAIVFFLCAVIGSCVLVVQTLVKDRSDDDG